MWTFGEGNDGQPKCPWVYHPLIKKMEMWQINEINILEDKKKLQNTSLNWQNDSAIHMSAAKPLSTSEGCFFI